jgi:hypothetical protein
MPNLAMVGEGKVAVSFILLTQLPDNGLAIHGATSELEYDSHSTVHRCCMTRQPSWSVFLGPQPALAELVEEFVEFFNGEGGSGVERNAGQ